MKIVIAQKGIEHEKGVPMESTLLVPDSIQDMILHTFAPSLVNTGHNLSPRMEHMY